MDKIEILRSYLAERHFQEAVTLTLTQILPEEHVPSQETAWDWLTYPGHAALVDGTTVKACPFLLGCLQGVRKAEGKLFDSWREKLASDSVTFFLTGQGQPLSDWHFVQAVIDCGKAALAIRRFDYAAALQHGASAAQSFLDTPVQHAMSQIQDKNGPLDSIEQCFAVLSQALEIPVEQACDLTHWFASLGQGRTALHTQRILVPFSENEATEEEGAVSQLEMELLEGRGEFYADPVSMAFVRWNDDFRKAYENAQAYVHQLGYWQEANSVRWRMQADPPLALLTGDSIGGAFFANLWHLLTRTPNDLSVTVSTTIDADGRVGPVGNIWPKIRAILKIPEISELIIAQDQHGVPEQYERLKIWKVSQAGNPTRHGRSQEG